MKTTERDTVTDNLKILRTHPARLVLEKAAPGEEVAQRPTSQRATLAAALLGFFVITLDAVVVNVALPSIGHEFGASVAGLQWIVDGYTLMFAALLLSAGSLSDRIGARRALEPIPVGIAHRLPARKAGCCVARRCRERPCSLLAPCLQPFWRAFGRHSLLG
jgi:hypothetical protein